MTRIPKVLLLIDSSRTAGATLLRGIARYSALRGPWTFFRNQPFYMQSSRKTSLLSHIKQMQINGIIMLEEPDMEKYRDLNIPLIVSPIKRPDIAEFPAIVVNDEKLGQMAADHLITRGFKHFAFCGFDGMFWSDFRGKGFQQQVKKGNFNYIQYVQPKKYVLRHWEQEQAILADWLKALPKPIGLFACNDDRSLQIVETCRMAGIHVPEEIAIIGVDNDILVCELSNPPLSSVALNFERAGFEAAELLARLMDGEPMAGQRLLIHELFIATRQSTDVLAIEDPEVAKAVCYIHQNFRKILQVDDVINTAAVSRRGLELRFRNTLGRSIYDEIRRFRVEQITKMLLESTMSITEISSEFGYTGIEHFARYFRQEKGVSPQFFRKINGQR